MDPDGFPQLRPLKVFHPPINRLCNLLDELHACQLSILYTIRDNLPKRPHLSSASYKLGILDLTLTSMKVWMLLVFL